MIESYAASRPQAGHSANEDAFHISRGNPPYAVLADGAGNAERAAKRVLALFEKLFAETNADAITQPETWARWVRVLNSSLQGSSQSTFLAIAVIDNVAVGVCVGDSRAYLVNRVFPAGMRKSRAIYRDRRRAIGAVPVWRSHVMDHDGHPEPTQLTRCRGKLFLDLPRHHRPLSSGDRDGILLHTHL